MGKKRWRGTRKDERRVGVEKRSRDEDMGVRRKLDILQQTTRPGSNVDVAPSVSVVTVGHADLQSDTLL